MRRPNSTYVSCSNVCLKNNTNERRGEGGVVMTVGGGRERGKNALTEGDTESQPFHSVFEPVSSHCALERLSLFIIHFTILLTIARFDEREQMRKCFMFF